MERQKFNAGPEQCPLLTQSGHAELHGTSAIGVKRTSTCALQMSAFDPKRTPAAPIRCLSVHRPQLEPRPSVARWIRVITAYGASVCSVGCCRAVGSRRANGGSPRIVRAAISGASRDAGKRHGCKRPANDVDEDCGCAVGSAEVTFEHINVKSEFVVPQAWVTSARRRHPSHLIRPW
jgi:hypothetical protein